MIVTFADKAAVREYVASRVGAEHLPQASIVDTPDELRSLALPSAYVVKPTHGSGAALVVSPTAPADGVLPRAEHSWVYAAVRPEAAPIDALVRIAGHWIGQVYGQGPNREWAYSQVRPRIIVEEMLQRDDGGIPDDVKFFVFHGVCRFIQLDSGRFGERTQDFFGPDWEHLALSGGYPFAVPTPPRLERLDEMIAIAERLGSETDFVRVDLYALPGRIVFGELTSYPAGGHSPFIPERFDTVFGAPWTVPRRYR